MRNRSAAALLSNRFAALWCGQFDRTTGILSHASAGHGDAVMVRASSQMERVASRGLALGLTRAARYSSGQLRLESGDMVAIRTDGVTEVRNAGGEEFSEELWAWAVVAAVAYPPERIVL